MLRKKLIVEKLFVNGSIYVKKTLFSL